MRTETEEKSALIWTKRRQLVILGHGTWLDEKTEQPGDNIKYRVKSAIKMIIMIMIIITKIFTKEGLSHSRVLFMRVLYSSLFKLNFGLAWFSNISSSGYFVR